MTTREELASLRLPERIGRVIDATGLDQEEFAAVIGATRETVNRWVNGQAKPGQQSRKRLAEKASELLGGPVRADLFRERPPIRPIEETLTELNATAVALRDALGDLRTLLAEQRQLVETMTRIADLLEQQ